AGVDQQGQRTRRGLVLLVLIVQGGGVLVQADDVAVGQVQVGVAGGGQVGSVDPRLGGAGQEGLARRQVARHRPPLGGAHAVQLVGRLVGAVVVQVVEQDLGIIGFEAGQGGIGLAD